MRGRLITLEGVEGSGKTTQAQRLGHLLASLGHAIVLTKEPGGTAFGDRVRSILLHPESGSLAGDTELFLLLAARSHHVAEVIAPALEAGTIVVCDRFADATVAYQGFGRGLPLAEVQRCNTLATGGIEPDLTLWLDLPEELGLARARQRDHERGLSGAEGRFEAESLAFHRRVQQGYAYQWQNNRRRIVRIDAALDVEQVWTEVKQAVLACLASAPGGAV